MERPAEGAETDRGDVSGSKVQVTQLLSFTSRKCDFRIEVRFSIENLSRVTMSEHDRELFPGPL